MIHFLHSFGHAEIIVSRKSIKNIEGGFIIYTAERLQAAGFEKSQIFAHRDWHTAIPERIVEWEKHA